MYIYNNIYIYVLHIIYKYMYKTYIIIYVVYIWYIYKYIVCRCFIEDPNDRASCEELMRLPFLITQSIEEVRAQTAAISNRYDTNHRTSTITLG